VVRVGNVELRGRPMEPVQTGSRAVLAVRPDDLVAQNGGELMASVLSTEFRGHGYTGFARTADGAELVFTSPVGAEPGSAVTLAADPERALVFAA